VAVKRELLTIGWREWVELPQLTPVAIKGKIDTGARTSTLHAFDTELTNIDGREHVTFEIHPHQRSRRDPSTVTVPVTAHKKIRSSTGHAELRPVISTEVRIGEATFEIELTLTSRDRMGFRLLLGRSALRRRYVVDAARSFTQGQENSNQRKKSRTR